MSRLKERYDKEVIPALKKEFGYTNVMAIPKVEKVVINMGLGEATSNAKIADVGADERLAGHYRLDAVRAHLFEMAGDYDAAIAHFQAAAERTTSIPERNYLTTQAARLRYRSE